MENNTSKVASGLFWSYGERIFGQLVSLIVSIILARLLTPENYGVISILMIFISFCDAIVTGGFGNAIVQKKDADELDANTMLCCSMTASAVLYGILFFAAPYVAVFYRTDIICPLLRVLGLRVLIFGLNTMQHAWIQKKMQFRKFFISSFFGTVISAVVGITLAYFGAGPWALVAQTMTDSILDAVILLFTCDWRPKLQFSLERAKSLLGYGGKVLLTTMVFTIGNDLRSLIVGRRFGPADLAFYDQGYKFPNLLVTNINSSVTSVMFPVLSQNQDNPERLKQLTRQTIRIGFYVLTPVLIGLIAVADSFVCAILSEKWAPCVPYMRVFTLIFLVRPFSGTVHQTILSVGRSDVILKIITTTTILSLAALFYAVFVLESVIWITYGRLIAEGINLSMFCYNSKKLLGYKFKEQLQDVIPNVLLAGIMGILTYFLKFLPMNYLLILVLQVLFGVAFYVLASWLLQAESFVFLVTSLGEHISSPKVHRILQKLVRAKSA